MSIDWFTLTAQIINFMVLVWLLRRFLYGPVMRAIDQRDAAVAARLQAANDANVQAEQTIAEHQAKLQELQESRQRLLAEAQQEIDQWKAEHVRAARLEVDQSRADWYRSVERERNSFATDLSRETIERVQRLTQGVLTELSGADVETQIVTVFLQHLQHLSDVHKTEFVGAVRRSSQAILVSSAFVLEAAQQTQIVAEIRKLTANDTAVEFCQQRDLICGIEITVEDYKVPWNVSGTLDSLRDEFSRVLDAQLESVHLEVVPPTATVSTADAPAEIPQSDGTDTAVEGKLS